MTINKSIPNIKKGSILFCVLTVLFLTLGAFTQKLNIYFGIFFTEVIILGGVTMFVSYRNQGDIYITNGLYKPKRGAMTRAVLMMIVAYPLFTAINGLVLSILFKFLPELDTLGVPAPTNFIQLIRSVLFFAVLPGIFEELLFRGFLFRAFEKVSIKKRILLIGFLFAIFHYNPYNFIGPFLIGIMLTYVRHRSGSVFPCMAAHVTNNSISMLLQYFVSRNASSLQTDDLEIVLASRMETTLITVIVLFIYIGLIALFIRMLKNYPDYNEGITVIDTIERKEKIYITVSVIVALIIFSLMTVFIATKL